MAILTREQEIIIEKLKAHMDLTSALNALDASIDDKEGQVQGAWNDEKEALYLEDLAALYWLRDYLDKE